MGEQQVGGIPVELDRYRVQKVLHQGDYTVVYTALHTLLGSQMALKLLAPGAPQEMHAALLQEGRIQAVVRHPHVLRVSDAFLFRGEAVLAMELVKGDSLADLLESGRIPHELAVSVFRGVTRGIRAIHKLRIVHRDLKPENVLLEIAGKRYRPLVADFGFAKILEPHREPKPRGLSDSYSFIGTPEYMAPEQANDPGRVDTRADLFSLGAVFYELLTGRVCFEEEADVDALYRAARGEYVRLDALRPDLDPRLVALVDGLLRPRPEERIQTAGDVLRQLDSL